MPEDIENEIFKYLDIKCHTCYRKIKNNTEYLNCIIQSKFIFCSKECYNFI